MKAIEKKQAHENYMAFSAKYSFAPDARAVDLATDAGCMLGPVISTVNLLAIELEDKEGDLCANPSEAASMLWGVMHQLNAIKALVQEMEAKS